MAGSTSHRALGVTATPDLGGAFDLTGAPAEYQLPATRPSLEEARQWCHTLTTHCKNLERFGVTDEQLAAGRFDAKFRALMEHLVTQTRAVLHEGRAKSQPVDRALTATLDLFPAGGDPTLNAIAAQGYNILTSPHEVSKGKKARLLAGALWGTSRSASAAQTLWELQAPGAPAQEQGSNG
jgi:hypothetical protein